jgi:threonyl-tRNA synthetase
MPERFELEYVGADGLRHRPVMIHRTVLGSLERFIGILTEHFAGAFPLWLAPVQIMVLPITERSQNYASTVADKLDESGFRVEVDYRSEKIGFKIREAQMQKIPYMLVLGDNEVENDTLTVRKRALGDIGTKSLDEFITDLKQEEQNKTF